MPITEHQKQNRGKHIGASESAAVLGLNPWKTAYDCWLEKTGKVDAPFSVGEAGDIGNMVENGLLDHAATELGVKILKNQFRVHEDGILSATHDALVVDRCEGLEAKTSGIMNPFAAKDDWGEADTDQVPQHILIQTQHQMLVSNLDIVHIPALIGGRGRVMFHVERSADLCAIILERVTLFWTENVQKDIPPEGVPSLVIVKLRKREPGLTLPIPAELVMAWQATAKQKKEVGKAEDEAKAACIAAMGDAEIGESEAGNVVVQKVHRKGYTVKESDGVCVSFQKAKQLKA